MKRVFLLMWAIVMILICNACEKELLNFEGGDIRVRIEEGDEWLHDFPLFLGINKQNAPQIAIWLEDTLGNYVSTVYVTHKIATQSWMAAGKNRRKEALPHWCYSRGVQYSDGLYLPTKKAPFVDGVSGATPWSGFDVRMVPSGKLKRFVVKIEINHSTDFNDHYPESSEPGDPSYSGGDKGSGQPAVVYSAFVDLESGQKEFEARLIGHSSPDGSDGNLYPELETLTTALHIVKRIVINLL